MQVSLKEKFDEYQLLIFDYLYNNAEEKEESRLQAVKDYVRLKKLKRLYGVIGREIQSLQKGISIYMDNTYVQTSIHFDQPG